MMVLRKKYYNLCILLIAISFAAWLSCRIDIFQLSEGRNINASSDDALYRIFGQLRKDMAVFCYLKTDSYFHQGTHHSDGHKNCFEDETSFSPEQQTGHNHGNESTGSIPRQTARKDLFKKIEDAVYSRPVSHIQAAENDEIIPWFEITAMIDPQFEKTYLDGSYWLSAKMGQPDKALTFLRSGFRHNPDSWQISAQIGNIYFINKKDYRKAYPYYKYAYTLLSKVPHTVSEEKQVLMFLSVCAEKTEKKEERDLFEKKLSEIRSHSL